MTLDENQKAQLEELQSAERPGLIHTALSDMSDDELSLNDEISRDAKDDAPEKDLAAKDINGKVWKCVLRVLKFLYRYILWDFTYTLLGMPWESLNLSEIVLESEIVPCMKFCV